MTNGSTHPTPSPQDLTEVGRRLQEIREAAGISIRALSKATGLSRSTIRRAENGAPVFLRNLLTIAGHIGADWGALCASASREKRREARR